MFKALLATLILACSLQVNAQAVEVDKAKAAMTRHTICAHLAYQLGDTDKVNKYVAKAEVIQDAMAYSDKDVSLTVTLAELHATEATVIWYVQECK